MNENGRFCHPHTPLIHHFAGGLVENGRFSPCQHDFSNHATQIYHQPLRVTQRKSKSLWHGLETVYSERGNILGGETNSINKTFAHQIHTYFSQVIRDIAKNIKLLNPPMTTPAKMAVVFVAVKSLLCSKPTNTPMLVVRAIANIQIGINIISPK